MIVTTVTIPPAAFPGELQRGIFMTPMHFTVITTCLNSAATIERTICSVLDQGYESLQYIVIDRGSKDETGEIISLYENELIWLSEAGATHAQALNTALSHAKGETIVFADDVLLPGVLHDMAKRMSLPGAPQWFVGHSIQLDRDDVEVGSVQPVMPASLSRYLMHDAGMLPLQSTFIARALLSSADNFDGSLIHAHDYDCWCRLMAQGHRPTVIGLELTGCWPHAETLTAAQTLTQGLEFITIARRYASQLSLRDQAALWRNCDQRQRIYALAEAELSPSEARGHLWQRLLSHPWWIMDESVRHTLMHGITHPAPAALTRTAA